MKEDKKNVRVHTTSTRTEEDIFGKFDVEESKNWGYMAGEKIWLGDPKDRPMDEYLVVDLLPTKYAHPTNDNFSQAKQS